MWQPLTLLLSLVLQTGPCRGRGHGRNCIGGRWPQAGCRSYMGRGTELPRRTLRHPRDAGGLSSACSPGLLHWSPVTEPKRTEDPAQLCKKDLWLRHNRRQVSLLNQVPGRHIWQTPVLGCWVAGGIQAGRGTSLRAVSRSWYPSPFSGFFEWWWKCSEWAQWTHNPERRRSFLLEKEHWWIFCVP